MASALEHNLTGFIISDDTHFFRFVLSSSAQIYSADRKQEQRLAAECTVTHSRLINLRLLQLSQVTSVRHTASKHGATNLLRETKSSSRTLPVSDILASNFDPVIPLAAKPSVQSYKKRR